MNDMIRPILYTALPICLSLSCALAAIVSCSTTLSPGEIWEGMHGTTLRVVVTLDTAPDPENGESRGSARDAVLRAGIHRAGTLLLSYARVHCTDSRCLEACRQSIPEIITRATLRHLNCSGEECTAVFDFNAGTFFEAARSHEPGR